MKKVMVIGGDERNFYLIERLNEDGIKAFWYASELFTEDSTHIKKEAPFPVPEDICTVVLPLPLSRDGRLLNCKFSSLKLPLSSLEKELEGKDVFTPNKKIIDGTDYFAAKSVTVRNARLTAIGLLKEVLLKQNEDILGKSALITGFGNVGKAVGDILSSNGVKVTVMSRSEENDAQAVSEGFKSVSFDEKEIVGEYDFIVNTVPCEVFGEKTPQLMKKNAYFFELAGTTHEKLFAGTSLYVDCRGLPGKHMPKSAGEIIADFVFNRLEE